MKKTQIILAMSFFIVSAKTAIAQESKNDSIVKYFAQKIFEQNCHDMYLYKSSWAHKKGDSIWNKRIQRSISFAGPDNSETTIKYYINMKNSHGKLLKFEFSYFENGVYTNVVVTPKNIFAINFSNEKPRDTVGFSKYRHYPFINRFGFMNGVDYVDPNGVVWAKTLDGVPDDIVSKIKLFYKKTYSTSCRF
jgi:hypothetical protein